MRRSMFVIATACLATPCAAQAQPYVEIGASIGQACVMGEASCADEVRAHGWQIGWWPRERMAVRFRQLDLPRPDIVNRQSTHTTRWFDRSRELWLGEMTFHFGEPHPARLFAGFTAGARTDPLKIVCEPVDGQEIPSTALCAAPDGRARLTLGAVGGVSIHAHRRMVFTLQVGAHDFPTEVGAFVFSVHATYRHPIGR